MTMIKEYEATLRTTSMDKIEGNISVNSIGDIYFEGEGHTVFIPYKQIKMIHSHAKPHAFIYVDIAWIYEIEVKEDSFGTRMFSINTLKWENN